MTLVKRLKGKKIRVILSVLVCLTQGAFGMELMLVNASAKKPLSRKNFSLKLPQYERAVIVEFEKNGILNAKFGKKDDLTLLASAQVEQNIAHITVLDVQETLTLFRDTQDKDHESYYVEKKILSLQEALMFKNPVLRVQKTRSGWKFSQARVEPIDSESDHLDPDTIEVASLKFLENKWDLLIYTHRSLEISQISFGLIAGILTNKMIQPSQWNLWKWLYG